MFRELPRTTDEPHELLPRGDDEELVKRFVEEPSCPSCGHTQFVLLNTTGESSELRADGLAKDPGFARFLVAKLKETGFWPDEFDEETFLELDLERFIARFEELAGQQRRLPDENTGRSPHYVVDGEDVVRYGEYDDDQILLERLAEKERFGYPIAQVNTVIQRAVDTCVQMPLAQCAFFAVPCIWYQNTKQDKSEMDIVIRMQYAAIENLFFELAVERGQVCQEDVIGVIRTLLRQR